MATATPPNTPMPGLEPYAGVVAFDTCLCFKDGSTLPLAVQFEADGASTFIEDLTEEEVMGAMLSEVRLDEIPNIASFVLHLSDGWENAPYWMRESDGELTIDLTNGTDNAKKWNALRATFLVGSSLATKTGR
jgi:hypothetical protein